MAATATTAAVAGRQEQDGMAEAFPEEAAVVSAADFPVVVADFPVVEAVAHGKKEMRELAFSLWELAFISAIFARL